MSNDENKKHHHGIVALLASDENGPTHIESVDPVCIQHTDEEPCPVGVCDEVVYEAPDAPSAGASVGYARTPAWRPIGSGRLARASPSQR